MKRVRRPLSSGVMLVLAAVMLSVSAMDAQIPSLIYSFDAADQGVYGPFPASVMAQGQDGNLYGTTYSGGTNTYGGIFVITPGGSETVLHEFTSDEGRHCNMGLSLGNDGNFYGACFDGGTSDDGEIYRVTTAGVLTILHSFTNSGSDGAEPNAPPIQASDGNFYGTTLEGGTNHDGTIYKLTPGGTLTTIHSLLFPQDGGAPGTALVQGSDGNLYGTTEEGAVIFRITTVGKYTVLHTFAVTGDGALPLGALVQGKDGNFYGTTQLDGVNGEGTVFKMTPAGGFTVLEVFNETLDGQGQPWVGLVQATDNSFYGVSLRTGLPQMPQYGGIYKVTAKGVYSSLYLFDGAAGANPASALIQHTNGLLYGDTENNGGFNVGTVYSYNIGAAPFCSLLTSLGKIAAKVGILGQGFSSSSVVKFAGVKATTVSASGSGYLTATVPPAALTGAVTVITGASKLTCAQTFKIIPMIKAFSPASGAVGTSVTFTGTGLTQTTKITFGGTNAFGFVVNSDTSITVSVPAGAKTGKIVVITKGGSAASATNFVVT
ncbi:MAG TPA: choice-of-anchor tandem repeat GloVer-containing protein [Candidatus Sulfotelmatobacter sp.]|jgi:uncharacterized repeat protein (TIGR03803 family)